jgi:hypothetical protein
MVWYFNMQGREVVSINARLEDLATIDAFCKKRNISRSSLMVRAALAFCAAKKGKPIQFRGLHTQQRGGGMSAAAAGYVLKVPTDRRELLLDEAEFVLSLHTFVAEPVSNFEHSRRAPLIVFASFEDVYADKVIRS